MARSNAYGSLTDENAAVLAELVVDPMTTENTKVSICKMLMEQGNASNFFEAMFKEGLSKGDCPHCGHSNYWLIPEDELNVLGWVTAEQDSRVPLNPTAEDCDQWQQACPKKKINY